MAEVLLQLRPRGVTDAVVGVEVVGELQQRRLGRAPAAGGEGTGDVVDLLVDGGVDGVPVPLLDCGADAPGAATRVASRLVSERQFER